MIMVSEVVPNFPAQRPSSPAAMKRSGIAVRVQRLVSCRTIAITLPPKESKYRLNNH